MIFAGANDLVEEDKFKVEHAARVNCAPKQFGLVKIFTKKRDQDVNAVFLEVVSVEWFHTDYGTKKYEAEECVTLEKSGLLFLFLLVCQRIHQHSNIF